MIPFFSKPTYILILNNNGLGDYFLIRNYFKYIKKSKKYKNHKIVFLAKADRIDIINKFDKRYIDEIIPFENKRFAEDINYQNRIITKLKSKNITDIVNIGCAYPKVDCEPESTIKICTEINAKNMIAHVIEPNDISLKQKYVFYTNVIYTPHKDMFEFERNKLFFEKWLGIEINEPHCPHLNISNKHKKQLIGFSPFKRDCYISWDIENWAELCNIITKEYPQYKVLLLGSKENRKSYNAFIKSINDKSKIINKIGKTKSSDLPEIISSLSLLISAETSSVHIASAVGTKTVCLSNGAFYKRFQPIPCDFIKYIYPEEFVLWKDNCVDNKEMNQYTYLAPFKLTDISAEKVLNVVKDAICT